MAGARQRFAHMTDPNVDTGEAVIVLADGGLVISADECAAAILGTGARRSRRSHSRPAKWTCHPGAFGDHGRDPCQPTGSEQFCETWRAYESEVHGRVSSRHR